MNLAGIATDAARLRQIADILRSGLGQDAAPLPTLVDLANRAIRPFSVLAVFAQLGCAFWEPQRYAAAMEALAATPAAVWAVNGVIIALHFYTRIGQKPA